VRGKEREREEREREREREREGRHGGEAEGVWWRWRTARGEEADGARWRRTTMRGIRSITRGKEREGEEGRRGEGSHGGSRGGRREVAVTGGEEADPKQMSHQKVSTLYCF